MKIFFTIKSLHAAAGTERVTIAVANELAKRNYEEGIIIFVKEGTPHFEVNTAVKLIYLHNKADKRASLTRDFSRRKQLKQIYKAEQPDVVIFVGSGRSMLNIPAAKGIPSITWEHFNAKINWHLFHPLSKWLAARFCDRIVTLTNQDAENYRKMYGAGNAVCIPNPITIDTSVQSPLRDKIVLSVGRLTEQKGFDMLLDAWSKVQNRKQGWKLRIVGNGKLKNVLLDKIDLLDLQDSVEITPPTHDIVSLYRSASIYVMSSRYEGLPMVLIEAMAMGLPIVSFDCETGPAEIVTDHVTGILVPPLDVNRLAIELDNLMQDKEKRELFSINSVEKAGLYSMDKIMEKCETLLMQLEKKTR